MASGTAPIVAFRSADTRHAGRVQLSHQRVSRRSGSTRPETCSSRGRNGSPPTAIPIFITSSTNGRTWSAKHPVETTRCVTTAGGPSLQPREHQAAGDAEPDVQPRPIDAGVLRGAGRRATTSSSVPAAEASHITGARRGAAARVAQLDAERRRLVVPLTHYSIGTDVTASSTPVTRRQRVPTCVNQPNLPIYAGGTLPFIRDYLVDRADRAVQQRPPASASRVAQAGRSEAEARTVLALGHRAGRRAGGGVRHGVGRQSRRRFSARSRDWHAQDRRTVVDLRAARRETVHQSGIAERHAVYTALVAPRLLAGTPTSFKDLGAISAPSSSSCRTRRRATSSIGWRSAMPRRRSMPRSTQFAPI